MVELRIAFQTCARLHKLRRQIRPFGTLQPLFKRKQSRSDREATLLPSLETTEKSDASAVRAPPQDNPHHVPSNESGSSRELIPDPSKRSSLTEGKRADVPMRIIPKAQITPELTLTPKERLQIEFLTRRPPRTEEKKSRSYTASRTERKELIQVSLQGKTAHIPRWNFKDQCSINYQSVFSASYVWFHFGCSAGILCIRIPLVVHSTA